MDCFTELCGLIVFSLVLGKGENTPLLIHWYKCSLIAFCLNLNAPGYPPPANTVAYARTKRPQSADSACCWHCMYLHVYM